MQKMEKVLMVPEVRYPFTPEEVVEQHGNPEVVCQARGEGADGGV